MTFRDLLPTPGSAAAAGGGGGSGGSWSALLDPPPAAHEVQLATSHHLLLFRAPAPALAPTQPAGLTSSQLTYARRERLTRLPQDALERGTRSKATERGGFVFLILKIILETRSRFFKQPSFFPKWNGGERFFKEQERLRLCSPWVCELAWGKKEAQVSCVLQNCDDTYLRLPGRPPDLRSWEGQLATWKDPCERS